MKITIMPHEYNDLTDLVLEDTEADRRVGDIRLRVIPLTDEELGSLANQIENYLQDKDPEEDSSKF